MNFLSSRNKIALFSFFIPFRVNFVLLILCFVAGFLWLRDHTILPESSYSAIIHLLVSIAMYFILIILILSCLTSLLPWLLFIVKRKQQRIQVKITAGSISRTDNSQPVSVSITPVYRPLFGFIRLRFQYDDLVSDKFNVLQPKEKLTFFNSTTQGTCSWRPPAIREYRISTVLIYFEDMFQLFSFIVPVNTLNTFYISPIEQPIPHIKVQPKRTEDTNIRIDKIRKVQGEYLSYKNFEDNDDVRRILWKIYAKNKELVVRIPETNDPYASHICFYASFYKPSGNGLNSKFEAAFLDHYKTAVWNTYLSITKQDMRINYLPDQPTQLDLCQQGTAGNVKYFISTAMWQNDKKLTDYFKKEDASVLCINSFTDSYELREISSRAGRDLVIVFIQLSKVYDDLKIKDWLQWLFIRSPEDSLSKFRFAWNVSPLKKSMKNNEHKLLEILQRSDCEKVYI